MISRIEHTISVQAVDELKAPVIMDFSFFNTGRMKVVVRPACQDPISVFLEQDDKEKMLEFCQDCGWITLPEDTEEVRF